MKIIGYYFTDKATSFVKSQMTISDDAAKSTSMLEWQRKWYNQAIERGYASGELDEEGILRENVSRNLSDTELIEIINDGDLMRLPLSELIHKLNQNDQMFYF